MTLKEKINTRKSKQPPKHKQNILSKCVNFPCTDVLFFIMYFEQERCSYERYFYMKLYGLSYVKPVIHKKDILLITFKVVRPALEVL